MRRGFMLYQHTGLRGSDVVRLGPTDVDTYQGRDAFALTTQKRKRDVWCPIMPALAAEMATWERRPGPYLLQQNGKPFTRKEFGRQFAEARDAIPELKGLTLHGLRDGGDQPAPRWSVVCADRRHRRHEREDGGALLPQCRHALEQPRRADASGAGDGALVRSPDTRCAR